MSPLLQWSALALGAALWIALIVKHILDRRAGRLPGQEWRDGAWRNCK
jgi:hypothetical protein